MDNVVLVLCIQETLHPSSHNRVYVGKDGDKLVILFGGGTKKKQQNDIDNAFDLWKEYKQRKKED